MTQGIRAFVNATFKEQLANLPELGNIAFRAEVMNQAIMAFGISVGSAATHYNHALKQARIDSPEAVKGLGRPEDKKGGRKPIYTVDVIKAKTGELVAAGISKAKAELLISKAAASKKPKLVIKDVEAVAVEAAPAETATEVALLAGAMPAEAAAA